MWEEISHFDQVGREVKRRRKTGEKEEDGKEKIFSAFRRSKLDGLELKLVHATRATYEYQN